MKTLGEGARTMNQEKATATLIRYGISARLGNGKLQKTDYTFWADSCLQAEKKFQEMAECWGFYVVPHDPTTAIRPEDDLVWRLFSL